MHSHDSRRPGQSRKRGKGSSRGDQCQPKVAKHEWKKETVCLRFKDQTKVPDTGEKMILAKMGLGLKETSFNLDGDGLHVHSVIQSLYGTQLEGCGGYKLMRPATNSTDLISIDAPRKGGINVKYLKHVLQKAKLYIVPLQKDISIEAGLSTEEVSSCSVALCELYTSAQSLVFFACHAFNFLST